MKKINIFLALIVLAVFTACENDDWSFPDYDYSTVYFSYQYPVRTITLGEDNEVNNDLDNEHKCKIMVKLAGMYENNTNVKVDFIVDNSLTDNLTFEDGAPVLSMPSNYYTLSSNQIIVPKGSMTGGVEVQLTDAFFADPDAIKNTYVIPVVMTNVIGVDSILRGKPKVDNPDRLKGETDWETLPKDYTLYAIKYINTWDAYYLRRGVDEVKEDGGAAQTITRHAQYVESDEVFKMSTLSFYSIDFPMTTYKNRAETAIGLNLKVDFNASDYGKNEQACTVSPYVDSYQLNDTVRVFNIAASGNGKFVRKGEKKSWGNEDRDALYLDYNVSYEVEINYSNAPVDIQKMEYSTKDTIVVRDRGIVMETFSPIKN